MRFSRVAAVFLTAVLATGCSSGSDEPGTRRQSSPDRLVNKSLTLTTDAGSALATLVAVTESYVPDNASSPNETYLAVGVTFEHKSGSYRAMARDFKLLKPGRSVIEANTGNARYAVPSQQQLPDNSGAAELKPGKFLSGLLVFETKYDPGLTLVAVDPDERIVGQWPLSGAEPTAGDGSARTEYNQTLTHTKHKGTAAVTLVAVSTSKGGITPRSAPRSGSYVIAELKYEGKAGEFFVSASNVRLRQPDGTVVRQSAGNSLGAVGVKQRVPSQAVRPGETVGGKIAFDVVPRPGSTLVLDEITDPTLGWPL
ncbi:hypothetical protein [Kibdelosporangium phytohabitans]|uniref:DUF4352 domain-containing protein n=1 Tax=Kibdelosporangium phytohabitans TaxID=860235 RepID=A0A0N9I4D6_9PSEU|nr:hypothetical protein [Kibdelosporangium phytohabitans]ALG10746.1 hypothetical protein AOZ06_31085 [Kibdelosporangium phytohabitans]MBE1461893.1 hypothetical protein [Kibdelosporangium phytohabitans]